MMKASPESTMMAPGSLYRRPSPSVKVGHPGDWTGGIGGTGERQYAALGGCMMTARAAATRLPHDVH
jgi:hypothetical protein